MRGLTVVVSARSQPARLQGPVSSSENFRKTLVLHGQNIGATSKNETRSRVEDLAAGGKTGRLVY